MTTHLLAIAGLAVVCGLWMALQLAGSADGNATGGRCGACREREGCSHSGEETPENRR